MTEMPESVIFIELTGFNDENSIRVRIDKIEVLCDMKDCTIVTTDNDKFSVTQTSKEIFSLMSEAYAKAKGLET